MTDIAGPKEKTRGGERSRGGGRAELDQPFKERRPNAAADKGSETTTFVLTKEDRKPGKLSYLKAGPDGDVRREATEGQAGYDRLEQQMRKMQSKSAASCKITVPVGANGMAMHTDIVAQGPHAAESVAAVATLSLLTGDDKTAAFKTQAKCCRNAPCMKMTPG